MVPSVEPDTADNYNTTLKIRLNPGKVKPWNHFQAFKRQTKVSGEDDDDDDDEEALEAQKWHSRPREGIIQYQNTCCGAVCGTTKTLSLPGLNKLLPVSYK